MRRVYLLFASRALSVTFFLGSTLNSGPHARTKHSTQSGVFVHFFLLFFFFVPTYHSQPSVTLLSVCRELQASDEKNLTSQLPCVFAVVAASVWRTHVHVRRRQIHEQNRTRRVPVAPSVDLRFRSFSIMIKPSLSSQRGLRRSAFHFQLFLRVR